MWRHSNLRKNQAASLVSRLFGSPLLVLYDSLAIYYALDAQVRFSCSCCVESVDYQLLANCSCHGCSWEYYRLGHTSIYAVRVKSWMLWWRAILFMTHLRVCAVVTWSWQMSPNLRRWTRCGTVWSLVDIEAGIPCPCTAADTLFDICETSKLAAVQEGSIRRTRQVLSSYNFAFFGPLLLSFASKILVKLILRHTGSLMKQPWRMDSMFA